MYRNDFSLHLNRISINPCILDVLRNLTNIERINVISINCNSTVDFGYWQISHNNDICLKALVAKAPGFSYRRHLFLVNLDK